MPQPKILVVDDQLLNIRLLERKLELNNMTVVSCTNGPEAINMARKEMPDVILLDIMMTGMNGIEVCRQLKEDAITREIPIIFITALTSKEEKIQGLDAGGADYVTKPLELDETLARVRTQMRIVEEHRENIRLTRQLEESRRQSALMHLTEGIAHNLNNLLGVMVGYVSLLERSADNPEKIINNCQRLDAAIKRMTRIVHQLTVMGHFKSLQTEPVELSRILASATNRFTRAVDRPVPVDIVSSFPEDYAIQTNRELLEVCLERLLINAFESYFSRDGDTEAQVGEIVLEVSLLREDGEEQLRLRVLDRGRGLDKTLGESIFEPFVSSFSGVGRGMGLTIARHSVSCLEGTIEVLDREDGGTQAVVTLPLHKAEALANAG